MPSTDLSGSNIRHIALEQCIGKGGMGEVYRGFDHLLQRPVAVKAIRTERRMETSAKARFLREARMLSQLDHPGICRVYDLVEGEDTDFLVLELIDGRTLDQALDEGLEPEHMLSYAQRIAEILAVAHERQIVHRDLKPGNVMLTTDGEVKILDFGLACSIGPEHRALSAGGDAEELDTAATLADDYRYHSPVVTAHGAVVGTPRYMSPEQALAEPVGAPADLYALGVIMQEMLTGMPVYDSSLRGADLLIAVASGERRPVEGLDAEMTRLIDDLTQLDPQRRPSAAETARRLQHIRQRPLRRRRRLQRLAAAAVFFALLVTAVLVTRRLTSFEPLLAPDQVARVALLPFSNEVQEAGVEFVELGLMDMVARTLASNPQLDVVMTDDVMEALNGLHIDPSAGLDLGAVDRLGAALGCRFLISTEVQRAGAGYRLRSTIFDRLGARGRVVVTGAELTSLAGDLCARLSSSIAPSQLIDDLRDRYSHNPLANQIFAAGTQRRLSAGPGTAVHYFRVCLDLDPMLERARVELASSLVNTGRWADGEELARELLGRVSGGEQRGLEHMALEALGESLFHQNRFDEAENSLRQALTLAEQLDDPRLVAQSTFDVGVVAWRVGHLQEARDKLEQALAMQRENGYLEWEATTLNTLGTVAGDLGDQQLAERYAHEALAVAEKRGLPHTQAWCRYGLGLMAYENDRAEEAVELFATASQLFAEAGDRKGQSWALSALGSARRNSDDVDGAVEAWLESLAISRRLGDDGVGADTARKIGDVHLQSGRMAEAAPFLEIALQLAPSDPDALLSMARLTAAKGDRRRALELANAARAAAGDHWKEAQQEQMRELREAAGRP